MPELAPVPVIGPLIDQVAGVIARRPVRVSMRPSISGLVSGTLDEVAVELTGVATSGLLVDRVLTSAHGVRLVPGLPPRLRIERVVTTGTVDEASLNRWLRTERTPISLRLTPEGIRAVTSLAGVRVQEVTTDLTVQGRWLTLRPRQVSVLGLPTPFAHLFRGFLPLPPLPAGARLDQVSHGEGTVSVRLDLGSVDEPVDLELSERLIRRFRLAENGSDQPA